MEVKLADDGHHVSEIESATQHLRWKQTDEHSQVLQQKILVRRFYTNTEKAWYEGRDVDVVGANTPNTESA